ncbi:MAG TPA: 23S rRNA (adenine(2503)-C(2))-methyltransferase RlmN [Terriglobia bacterium]|nr:23S rRNA (adenine(2503)-C(2))-methyltransferase RlmN [Terriglobia bacterium]
MGPDLKEILGLTSQELCGYLAERGEPRFHGRQIYRAVYVHRKSDFNEITELPRVLRAKLSRLAQVSFPTLRTLQQSMDGTEKYLLELTDHCKVEAIWIPEERRTTFCISTQVGCAMDCQFCLTALMGFSRNLTAGEIIGQILYILRDHERRDKPNSSHPKPINIVLMGMGEPLHNLPEVVRALVLMTDTEGLSLPRHRITLSTVGLVPKILELANAPVVPNLAVSLSATTDEVRNRLVPINRKYPIRELLEACAQFPLGPKQYLTFEYVLIDRVNDSDQDARRLVKLLAPLRAKVNLLPLNPGNAHDLKPSTPERVLRFQEILVSKNIPAFVRRPRGIDISAACGQLHHLQKDFEAAS